MPDTLVLSLRPVAMSSPPTTLILQSIFLANWFDERSALSLSAKLAKLFCYSAELDGGVGMSMSHRFGLRALKRVVNLAGQILRDNLKTRVAAA